MKNIIALACLLILPSCAFDYAKTQSFTYASSRVGTDTEEKSLEISGSSFKQTIKKEVNSTAFGSATSYAKFAKGVDTVSELGGTVVNKTAEVVKAYK